LSIVHPKVNSLDRSFLALAHPVRRSIVDRLSHGPATVADAARGSHVSKPAVTKHVKVLEDAGLVERRVEGRTHVLTLRTASLDEAEHWLERHRAIWEATFDAVERRLAADE
jgi:DNA-binding transcriptional ArsR family regulator